MAYPGATIYGLNGEGVTPVAYEETEHYRITLDFLRARETFLHHLFAGESGA